MEQPVLIYPDPISVERVSYLINQKGIDPVIANLDLEMVKMKLREPEEGENWTHKQCDSAEIEYKRYLHLCMEKELCQTRLWTKFGIITYLTQGLITKTATQCSVITYTTFHTSVCVENKMQ